jgi:glycosyltransferase involved in cell wall biosynthesis
MKLLFCCEFYHPSRGGVQEVMRQIAERMVQLGHDVTVATTALPERDFSEWNGVKIVEFNIRGNRSIGLKGNVADYVEFLKTFPADAIMIKAAQQWTFDAAWDALDTISARKVFIPCGYSGLYLPEYRDYFKALPDILAKFDRLIFYAERYRDIDFSREHGQTHFDVVPNGASDIEFAVAPDASFRETLGIAQDEIVLLTVGSPINSKGHLEAVIAFNMLERPDERMILILNGNWPEPPMIAQEPPSLGFLNGFLRLVDRAKRTLQRDGIILVLKYIAVFIYYKLLAVARRFTRMVLKPLRQMQHRVMLVLHRFNFMKNSVQPLSRNLDEWIALANAQPGKRVIKTNLPRPVLVQAFLNADLFVFASNIEYSPLVLFEACAAGLPFISGPVGNSEEIARWTGGGIICPAQKDKFGYTRVDPAVLASKIDDLLSEPALRQALSQAGRKAWQDTYNWGAISRRYEATLRGDTQNSHT